MAVVADGSTAVTGDAACLNRRFTRHPHCSVVSSRNNDVAKTAVVARSAIDSRLSVVRGCNARQHPGAKGGERGTKRKEGEQLGLQR